jgi:sugar O-acyltransferase (sialic acid O-acetyltransferase NeuD family)
MKKENILVFGASEHARYTIDIIEKEGKYNIVGIIDSGLKNNVDFASYKVLGKVKELASITKSIHVNKGIVAIGDNFTRCKVVKEISNIVDSFSFISAIHPSVIFDKNVKIGAGTLIKAGVIIGNDVTIGSHCFLATKASLAHDSILGNFSSLSPGVTTGGNLKIGKCTIIGLGTNIIQGITIGSNTVIGAGSLVLKDVTNNVVAFGVPAKVIRKRKNEDKYL